ncbi:CaiB/BaiF CoA-transferase family protein [Pusillimonas sp. SM2304]|uniref:CaiB/BaiF CoA transferase family protein n=1 Tax=Pusillimonas sp. SM2304 TaxID=3073241 RepID=UPI0028753D14|nr:CaiB/BaiF CoA-transferase family protein [Pusillimonas sp. SM2304]MDS1139989.1 CaiB/BaiF CoA-transferase family protein [Pusillimonas sp. SM2304]
MSERKAPLDGIRVLDLSRVLAGPWCSQNLADLGADVIKVERPGTGDDTRGWGPPYLKDADGKDTSEAAYYLSTNRNKRSIAIDIASPEGAELVREIAKQCDILVENFKVGGLKKYGLDYDSIKQVNPRLIYCSITGFGQTGPMAPLPGYDFMIQGMGGLMSITGERDDLPGGGPQKAGVAVTDLITGMYATVAVLGALQERQRSGLGQFIDVALLDCHVAMLANQNLNYMTSGVAPTRAGNAHQNVVPYQVFAASDGHLIVAIGNDSQYRAYCQVMGRPDLAEQPGYATNSQRLINRVALIQELEAIMKTRQRDDWIAALQKAGVPCGPINNIEQVFQNPQVQAREIWKTLPHPVAGTAPTTANPIRYSDTPIQYRMAPPLLGEHTDEILAELGLKRP